MEVIIGMKNKFNGSEPEGKVTVKAIGEFKIQEKAQSDQFYRVQFWLFGQLKFSKKMSLELSSKKLEVTV